VRPLPAKCADCHEESYAKTREEWQGTTKNLLNSLRAALAKMKSLALSEEEKSEIQRAEQLLQKIESDGSAGVHNFVFIEDVLTSLLKKVK
jgi:maltooligosyltrehalose synthase